MLTDDVQSHIIFFGLTGKSHKHASAGWYNAKCHWTITQKTHVPCTGWLRCWHITFHPLSYGFDLRLVVLCCFSKQKVLYNFCYSIIYWIIAYLYFLFFKSGWRYKILTLRFEFTTLKFTRINYFSLKKKNVVRFVVQCNLFSLTYLSSSNIKTSDQCQMSSTCMNNIQNILQGCLPLRYLNIWAVPVRERVQKRIWCSFQFITEVGGVLCISCVSRYTIRSPFQCTY
jgi:hypothetical protein